MVSYSACWSAQHSPHMSTVRGYCNPCNCRMIACASPNRFPDIVEGWFTDGISMSHCTSTCAWQKQSKLEAAVIFLDAVVTQVSAAHLQAGAARHEGILRELESLLQEVREGQSARRRCL